MVPDVTHMKEEDRTRSHPCFFLPEEGGIALERPRPNSVTAKSNAQGSISLWRSATPDVHNYDGRTNSVVQLWLICLFTSSPEY